MERIDSEFFDPLLPADQAEAMLRLCGRYGRGVVREHRDDLSRAQALAVLVADLRRLGRIAESAPSETDLALLIIGGSIQYPPPAPGLETGTRASA